MNKKEVMTGEELGEKLLASIQEMKAGKAARIHTPEIMLAIKIRKQAGLTQSQFAALLNIPLRTLQEWEQGRRQPSDAAKTLLRLLGKHPELLDDLAA